ncbi:MAG: hypothetical protein ACXVZV_16035, partial [Terriglobales bacterium]
HTSLANEEGVSSNIRSISATALIILAVAIGLGIAAYVVDVHSDRQANVTIKGPVRVYDRESPPGYSRGDDGVIEFLHPGDPARVLRIYDDDGFQAIRVRLPDGREGYIFCCDNFELSR